MLDKAASASIGILCVIISVSTFIEMYTAVTGAGPHRTPDTGAMWQQANTDAEQHCKLLVLKEVLKMQLPPEAFSDPELANAMQAGYTRCLRDNKVMI